MVCEPNQEATASAKLKVNGQVIELNPFVTSFIAEAVIGMLKPLRGINDVETVELNISRKAK